MSDTVEEFVEDAVEAEKPDADAELAERRRVSQEEVERQVPHFQQTKHRNDQPHPIGMQRIRVDGGGASVPAHLRQYAYVRTGFGEGQRGANARATASVGCEG
jgi:hypothetical protein